MTTTEFIVEAFQYTLDPTIILIIVLCTIIGIVMGALPGIGPTLTLALAFPFTFALDPQLGLLIMAVLYGSSIYGGSVSAILVNVPGTPGSAATLLDGFPMTQNGEGARALGIGTLASFIGGIIGLIILAVFGPRLARFALLLGPAEFFMMAILGLSVVAVVSRGPLTKSMASVSIGVFLASIGTDPITGGTRFTYDSIYLFGGIEVIVAVVGLFAIGQVFDLASGTISISSSEDVGGSTMSGAREVLQHKWTVVRSGLIGIGIGSIPGVGATSSNFMAYFVTQQKSENQDQFGSGAPDGIASAEGANNASAMGSLIPTMAFGIPGSAATAVFLGLMITLGISPGADVFSSSLPYVVFVGILLGNIAFLVIGLAAAKYIARVAELPTIVLLISITVVSLAGTFAVRNNFIDVGVAILIGIFAFWLRQRDFSLVALILAYILVPIAERGFRQALIISSGDYTVFVTRPISLLLLVLSVTILLFPVLKGLYRS